MDQGPQHKPRYTESNRTEIWKVPQTHCHGGAGGDFLNITPIAQTLRSTINKWDLMKTKPSMRWRRATVDGGDAKPWELLTNKHRTETHLVTCHTCCHLLRTTQSFCLSRSAYRSVTQCQGDPQVGVLQQDQDNSSKTLSNNPAVGENLSLGRRQISPPSVHGISKGSVPDYTT